MARFKTFTNGGSFSPQDMDDLQAAYEPLFSIWKSIGNEQFGTINTSTSAVCALPADGSQAIIPGVFGFPLSLGHAFSLPQVPNPGRRMSRMRLVVEAHNGYTSTGVNMTVSLCPVVVSALGSISSISDPIIGSSVSFIPHTDGTSLVDANVSPAFATPSLSQFYCIAVKTDDIAAPGSTRFVRANLQFCFI